MTCASDFIRLHRAFCDGDLAQVRASLGAPDDFPNCVCPDLVGTVLVYAIYHSPLTTIAELLQLGADTRRPVDDGFPPLHAALSSGRKDREAIVALLLGHDVDIEARGINNLTPLHHAVGLGDIEVVRMLLEHGADPHARTIIDDNSTPLEDAIRMGRQDIAAVLLAAMKR